MYASWMKENYQSYLVAWVPPQFLDLAQAGIDVNSTACIGWLSDHDTVFTRYLRREGLLA
jgi:hypothetical protein